MKQAINIENRKAHHDYFIEDTLECGIELRGNEVKSIKSGMCSLRDSWVTIQNNELVIRGMHITKYDTANDYDVDVKRERKLLAHRKEINKFADKIKLKGMTLIPVKVYESHGKIKVLVGLARGKHNYDKRNSLKESQMKRDIDRALKAR